MIVSLGLAPDPCSRAVGFKSVFGKYPLYPGMWEVTLVVPILLIIHNKAYVNSWDSFYIFVWVSFNLSLGFYPYIPSDFIYSVSK